MKLLKKMGVEGLTCPDERWLQNINTRAEWNKLMNSA